MQDPVWTSVIPPLLAIGLAIVTRQVILSLSIGLWMGAWLLGSGNPLVAIPQAIDAVINVFTDPGDTRVLVFTLVIGGLIATIEKLGGVRGFIHLLQERKWVTGPGRAQWLAFGTGVVVFIESNITLLIAGAISRPLFDRYRVSREKLAYIIDATSAPICVLIPLNAWGAVIVSLLASSGIENPIDVFIGAILLNFYAIFAVLVCALVIWSDFDIGPMRAAQKRTAEGKFLWPNATPMVDPSLIEAEQSRQPQDSAKLMLLPVLALVLSMPLGLFITGEGDLTAGSGSTSVLWAVLIALGTAWAIVLGSRRATLETLMQLFLKGAGGLLPVAMILLFSLALGDVANALGTGVFVAQLAQETIPSALLLPLLFLLSAFIAFSIGSSWGTFAIMIPLAMQIVAALDMNASVFLAAVLSGAVFGDHASPISDTTVVASMAAATDHIDHVRTQLPYALISAGLATVAFFVSGLVLL
ncbi:C4-dicarboxylate ABC transporter [Gammaproteobacteria bacterium]|jgi:tetracycline resistance efflux pump|nr:C4-dicarboxylate ABC transporter [Gammaproteobacteria bacterium]MCH9855495.1 C4-dicarboxylate ABC transporter [Gammaproteobacteria bacterium]MDA7692234.1 C4-dicarboxylate ABC transporter [Gammaproteobacteria bacterium]MDA7782560.1 C4-dicarboxylate ABC transporter [Gammaproteobacteria bacterium]MDA8602116.1 C4-dicarboxylate ABC transporter [Gammaproteobacteria bacterium]